MSEAEHVARLMLRDPFEPLERRDLSVGPQTKRTDHRDVSGLATETYDSPVPIRRRTRRDVAPRYAKFELSFASPVEVIKDSLCTITLSRRIPRLLRQPNFRQDLDPEAVRLTQAQRNAVEVAPRNCAKRLDREELPIAG